VKSDEVSFSQNVEKRKADRLMKQTASWSSAHTPSVDASESLYEKKKRSKRAASSGESSVTRRIREPLSMAAKIEEDLDGKKRKKEEVEHADANSPLLMSKSLDSKINENTTQSSKKRRAVSQRMKRVHAASQQKNVTRLATQSTVQGSLGLLGMTRVFR
jgi:hypothetical protein